MQSPQSIITTSSILWLLSIIFIIISFMTSIDRVFRSITTVNTIITLIYCTTSDIIILITLAWP